MKTAEAFGFGRLWRKESNVASDTADEPNANCTALRARPQAWAVAPGANENGRCAAAVFGVSRKMNRKVIIRALAPRPRASLFGLARAK